PEDALPERFRLRVGGEEPKAMAAALRVSARAAAPKAVRGGPVYRGRLTVSASVSGRGIQMVKFFLDGHLRAMDNNPPFSWEWDTRSSTNGEHVLEIQGLDQDGKLINSTKTKVSVAN